MSDMLLKMAAKQRLAVGRHLSPAAERAAPWRQLRRIARHSAQFSKQ